MAGPIPLSAVNWFDLFDIFLIIGLIAGTLVMGSLIYFALKYRQKPGEPLKEFQLPPLSSRVKEALIFASISGVVLFGVAVVSYRYAANLQYTPPVNDSLVIKVTAFQWDFRFTYPNGYSTIGQVRVPAGRNIIFNVTSTDVFHNFGLPDFKVKIDAIPGRYNTLWISAPELNGAENTTYEIKCYELCGAGHPFMVSNLIDMNPTQFDQWYSTTTAQTMSMGGK
jgi:cytochrome c oxidase subunit 2